MWRPFLTAWTTHCNLYMVPYDLKGSRDILQACTHQSLPKRAPAVGVIPEFVMHTSDVPLQHKSFLFTSTSHHTLISRGQFINSFVLLDTLAIVCLCDVVKQQRLVLTPRTLQ